jgi:hypothetical protein
MNNAEEAHGNMRFFFCGAGFSPVVCPDCTFPNNADDEKPHLPYLGRFVTRQIRPRLPAGWQARADWTPSVCGPTPFAQRRPALRATKPMNAPQERPSVGFEGQSGRGWGCVHCNSHPARKICKKPSVFSRPPPDSLTNCHPDARRYGKTTDNRRKTDGKHTAGNCQNPLFNTAFSTPYP